MASTTGNIIPALQYENAPAAIEWLCKVMGFQKHLVVPAGENKIAHAQLTLGTGMIMLSSINDTDYSKHMTTPAKAGDKNTQSSLIFVADNEIEAHFQNAKNQGASFLVALRSEEYGGRYYSLKDPEGHLWSIGSYDPYAEIKHS